MKPARMEIQAQNIPPELWRGKKWIVWRWEERDGRWTKPPYDAKTGRFAKSDDPSTWTTFSQAWNVYSAPGSSWDGIGYVLQKGDGLAGFDWDKCRNPETGEIQPDVLEKVRRLNSYTEVSPSGTGLKSLARGKFPGKDRQDDRGGLYSDRRYFCITGRVFDGLSPKIETRKDVVEALYRELFPHQGKPSRPEPTQGNGGAHGLGDSEIIEKAMRAKDGGKFRALWQGDTSGYTSQSEADLALCMKLAFWVGADPTRIDALFRQSKLMREKWDREGYAQRTIDKAVSETTEFYKAGKPPEEVIEWPDPTELPSLLPAVPVMPAEFLPETLRAYAADVAERMQIPLEFVGVPLIVALGFLVARKVAILPKRHDNWLVVPNLWGMTVGRPGVLKSPAQEKAVDPVEVLEIRARREFKEESKLREAGKEVLELKAKDIKRQMGNAIKNGNDGLLRELQKSLADINEEKERAANEIYPTYIVTDTTVEKLQEHMANNPGGLILVRDELSGLFATFEKQGREGDREFYLEAWSGTKSYKCDRIIRGSIYIERNRLSIIGSIQPGKLQKHVQRALEGETGDDGLLQRFQLVVWPEVSPEWRQVDRWENLTAREAALQVFRNIDSLNPSAIGIEQGKYDIMPSLRFSRDGQEIFDEWFCKLECRVRDKELKQTPAFESHLAKYRSLMPSLALIFHVADVVSGKTEGPVSREAALRAVTWCEYLEAHAEKVYAEEMQGEILSAHALAEKITSGAVSDGDSIRDIWRNGWTSLGSPEKVLTAIRILEKCSWVRQQKTKSQRQGGRPSHVVRINPKLHQSQNGFGSFGSSSVIEECQKKGEKERKEVIYVFS